MSNPLDSNSLLNKETRETKPKFNQASWNYPEETEILVIGKPNKQKTDWDLKLKLVREISEAMAYEYSEYDAMNNNDTPEDIAVNLLDKFLSTQREEIIKEIEGIVGGDTGGTGQVYFYKKQLRKQIREIKTNY